jgi:hypothetical protein
VVGADGQAAVLIELLGVYRDWEALQLGRSELQSLLLWGRQGDLGSLIGLNLIRN